MKKLRSVELCLFGMVRFIVDFRSGRKGCDASFAERTTTCSDSFAERTTTVACMMFGCLLFVVPVPRGYAQDVQFTSHLPHRWEIDPELGGTWLPPSQSPLSNLAPNRLRDEQRRRRVDAAQQVLRAAQADALDMRESAAIAALEQLEKGEENRSLRLALVSVVIASSNGQHAARLWKSVEPYPDAIPAVLHALVNWKSPVGIEFCRERLQRFEPPWSEVQLAIDNVAIGGGAEDVKRLEGILRADDAVLPVRLAAARALGQVVGVGLESLAQELLDSNLPLRDLLAAHLLAKHNSAATNAILNDIIRRGRGEAIQVAFTTLSHTKPDAARGWAEQLAVHPDSAVRLMVINVLDGPPNETALRLLVASLADPNIEIRSIARQKLLEMATDREWRASIADNVRQLLSSDRPASIEQAILLTVELNHVENCGRLVELLEHPFPSVSIAAAWALQELDVQPDLLATLLEYASMWSDRMHGRRSDQITEAVDFVRLAYIFERFGRARYAPATAVMNEFVQKRSPQMEPTVRASAIWAIAKIEAETGNDELAGRFLERLLDNEIGNTENELVKFASALALGELAPAQLREAILAAPENQDRKVWQACVWASIQIDRRSKPLPAVETADEQ